jgi:hypothetical protein
MTGGPAMSVSVVWTWGAMAWSATSVSLARAWGAMAGAWRATVTGGWATSVSLVRTW